MLAAHRQEIVAVATLANQLFQLVHGNCIVEPGVVLVPLVDDPSPRGPAPDAEIRREEVVALRVIGLLFYVEAAHHRDALVMLVAVEHLLAEREEADGWHVVVLQHNAFVNTAEGPLLRDVLRRVTAVVPFLVECLDLTVPIDLGHHLAAGQYAGHVCLRARSVLIEEKPRRTSLANLGKDLTELLRPVEEQNEYGNID